MREFLLILCLCHAVVEGSQYYVTDDATTRQNVHTHCTLATPSLSFNTNGIYLDTSDLIDIPGHVNNIWLGYVHVFRTFQYKGCLKTTDWKPASGFVTKADIGLCYSACSGKKYFGLQSQRSDVSCYCFDEGDLRHGKWTESSCTETCSRPQDTACGGRNGLSLYQKVDHVFGARVENEFCVYYQPVEPSEFIWGSCYTRYGTFCQTSGGTISTINKYGTWIMAANECFNGNMYPVEYRTQLHLIATKQLWTGMLGSYSYLQATDYLSLDGVTGYVYYNAINKSLKVEDIGSLNPVRGHALCIEKGTTTVATETTSTNPPPATKTTESTPLAPVTRPPTTTPSLTVSSSSSTGTTSTAHTTPPDTQSTNSDGNSASTTSDHGHTEPSSARAQSDPEQSDNSVAVYIGVPIALVFVVAFAVGAVIFIIRRRRRNTSSNDNKRPPQNYVYTDPVAVFGTEPRGPGSKTDEHTQNRITNYERISNGALDLGHHHQESDTDMYNYISDNAMNKSDKDEGDYGQNVYHILEKEDKVTSTQGRANVAYEDVSDDTYYDSTKDTPVKSNVSDNVYSKAKFNAKDESSDTYNHAWKHGKEVKCKTDVANRTDRQIDKDNTVSDKHNGDTSQPVYHILEKEDSDKPAQPQQDAAYEDVSDERLNKTGQLPDKYRETENVYNKANFPAEGDSGDTYDHTGMNTWKQDEGAYDVTDTQGRTKEGNKHHMTGNDATYDHTDMNRHAAADTTYAKANFNNQKCDADSNTYNMAVFLK